MDKRKLRKIEISPPKSSDNKTITFSLAHGFRGRVLVVALFEHASLKGCVYVDKIDKELLYYDFEKKKWYKRIPDSFFRNDVAHINTKIARKYFSVTDEKVNMITYIDSWYGKICYKKKGEREAERQKDYNKYFASLPRLPKGAYRYGEKLLGDCLLYQQTKVYCVHCKTWHTVSKRPVNGSVMRCPNCRTKATAKPLVSTLENEKAYFYVLQKHKGKLVVNHCRYNRTMNIATKVFGGSIDIYWVDTINLSNGKLEKFKYDLFEETFVRGRGMRWSTWREDRRYDPHTIYTGNLKALLKSTPLKYMQLQSFNELCFAEDVFTFALKHANEAEMLCKTGNYKLLSELSYNPKKLDKLREIPKHYMVKNPNLWLCDYEAMSKTNGRISAEVCKKIPTDRHYGSFVDAVNLTRSTGDKVLEYLLKFADVNHLFDSYNSPLVDYSDYLTAVQYLFGTVPKALRFPKDLEKAHDSYIAKQKLKKNKELDSLISKVTENLPESIEFGGFVFCIAHSYEFLLHEGEMMKHCVGGENYGKSVANGKILIISMRLSSDVNKPVYTMEYSRTNKNIVQLRGFQNGVPKKQDKLIAEQFIKQLGEIA